MRPDLEIPMNEFNRMNLKDQINALCDYHECDKKLRQLHVEQYTQRRWNPHPPRRFIKWWATDGVHMTEKKTDRAWTGIDAVRAFNCEAVREVYREAKEVALA